MLRSSLWCLGRAKGPKPWSPLGARSGSGAGARPTLTASEALQLIYRPLPFEHSVEAEEDFGHNLLVHRESFSQRSSRQMSEPWDMQPHAGSDVEMQKARELIARGVNEQRAQMSKARAEFQGNANNNKNGNHSNSSSSSSLSARRASPQLEIVSNLQDEPGSLRSAKFVFDEERMKFCERFQRHYFPLFERHNSISGSQLLALMEAAAVLYGCVNEAGREAWYRQFLGLDRMTLEGLAEQRANARDEVVRALEADAEDEDKDTFEKLPEEKRKLLQQSLTTPAAAASNVENKDENGRDDDDDEYEIVEVDDDGNADSTTRSILVADKDDESTAARKIQIPNEFASLYLAQRAYCQRKAPTFGSSSDARFQAATVSRENILMKHKWRRLLEMLVAEELPAADEESDFVAAAVELNDQLRCLKLLDARVGEAVKEQLRLAERSAGSGIALQPRPSQMSPGHPDLPQAVPR